MKHHITKYRADGKQYVVSWMQFNVFKRPICFWEKVVEI